MMTLGIAWNPVIGIAEAVLAGFAFFIGGVWLSWLGSGGARIGIRTLLVGLRAVALGLLVLVWLNPGNWEQDPTQNRREWMLLLDRSGSMSVEQDPDQSRWNAAGKLAEELRGKIAASEPTQLRTFSEQLEEEVASFTSLSPNGAGTDLGRTLNTVLDQSLPPAGVIVFSDGRQTGPAKADEIGRRARGRGTPIHVVPMGTTWGDRDLILTVMQRRVNAFKGQPAKITATLENRGLGAIKAVVTLTSPNGKEVARKDVLLDDKAPGNRTTVAFQVEASEIAEGDYVLQALPWAGEQIPTNNRASVRVDILKSKTRVLLLEGSPYWDSKFLAQLLRQQGAVDILTVHRLNEERYFRVEAAGAEPLQSPDSVFPRTAEELRRYDLIVFGKGADGFLDAARVAAVQGFVRDQGGAVLFARGKPYRGRFAPLESLESVEWGEAIGAGVRFTPVMDASAGLFGAALPGVNERIWSALPPLEDARGIAKLKPFARILAEGTIDNRQTKVPLLIARRYGRGMVATVNADGLWRWDFNADAVEHTSVYQDFWVQLMQWCATYSDFRPGQDYAVRLRESSMSPGQSVRAVIAYRGSGMPEPKPSLRVSKGGKPVSVATATALPVSEGSREWASIVTIPEPGAYDITVIDEGRPGKEEGEARLAVTAPPVEADDYRPDREFLATLARESGGKVWAPNEISGLGTEITARAEMPSLAKAEWIPLWPKWWIAVLVVLTFGSEWWMRRREGLW